jgi:hypothetical protein
MLANQAWVMAKVRNHSNVIIHPATLLIALVAAAFFHSGDAKASEAPSHDRADLRRHVLPILVRDMGAQKAVPLDASDTATLVSNVLIGLQSLTVSAPNLDSPSSGAAAAPEQSTPSATLLDAPANDSAKPPPTPLPFIPAPSALTSTFLSPVKSAHAFSDELTSQVASATADRSAAIQLAGLSTISAYAATLHINVVAPIAPIGAVLLQIQDSDAAQIVQETNILGSLLTSSAPIGAPVTLLELVDHGKHYVITLPTVSADVAIDTVSAAHTPATDPGASDSASTPTPVSDVSPASPSEPASVASTPSEQANPLPVVSNNPAAPVTAPSAPPPTPPLTPNSPVVTAAISHFAAEVSVLDVAYSGHEIILYDGGIFHNIPYGTPLDSTTFNFADGSSISLVGTAAEIQALHLS